MATDKRGEEPGIRESKDLPFGKDNMGGFIFNVRNIELTEEFILNLHYSLHFIY